MRKIGFIDYFLDEWHANNYPLWITDPRHCGRYGVAHAWAAMDKPGGQTTGEWCARFGVAQAASQEELIEKSDCIIVLSPDNPEQHEALAALALKSGKPVYVDKTFAKTHAAAERMFNLAEKHGTPMYSTSALRYATELNWLSENEVAQAEVEFASARGPGVFENYGIHQIEMIVAAMGTGALRAIAHGTDKAPVVVYEYAGGRSSVVNHLPWSGFSLVVQDQCRQGFPAVSRGEFLGWFRGCASQVFRYGRACGAALRNLRGHRDGGGRRAGAAEARRLGGCAWRSPLTASLAMLGFAQDSGFAAITQSRGQCLSLVSDIPPWVVA